MGSNPTLSAKNKALSPNEKMVKELFSCLASRHQAAWRAPTLRLNAGSRPEKTDAVAAALLGTVHG
ncbi:hypothetical protein, partial [Rhodoferax ferrireducens]|uniref:hypothetical protein n=1 Tax=Rhodoferax ferrireducens TaxID=192843 RepID=UPI003BB60EBC